MHRRAFSCMKRSCRNCLCPVAGRSEQGARRRSAGCLDDHGPGGQQGAVRSRTKIHLDRIGGRRASGRWGTRTAGGHRAGLLRPPDDLLGREAEHDDRSGGNLRAGARSAYVRYGDRSRRDCQRNGVRAWGLRVFRRQATWSAPSDASLRAGRVFLNGVPSNTAAPMGGYKRSGNGREMGVFGLEEYLEVKAMIGFEQPEFA